MCSELIIICCIIHNILLPSGDTNYEVNTNADIRCDDVGDGTEPLNKNFEIKRQALYSLMFE